MVQERIDDLPVISSLQRVPDGRLFNPHARDRQIRAQSTIERRNPPKWERPRADAIPTHAVPTLIQGMDRLPKSCEFCGAKLALDHGLDGDVGRILCQSPTCGRQVAWLRSSYIPTRALPLLSLPLPVVVRRPIRSGRFKRTGGCGRLCSEEYGHDAATHEQYGRTEMRKVLGEKPSGIVVSGAVSIDMGAESVSISGSQVALTDTELRIMLYLASRAGKICRYHALVVSVWDEETADRWGCPTKKSQHVWGPVRVYVNRIRGKLGTSATQVETLIGAGIRLKSDTVDA